MTPAAPSNCVRPPCRRSDLLARDVQGRAGAAAALLRRLGGRPATAAWPAARRRLPQARARGRPARTAPIWIDDSAALTPLAMRAKARRLKVEQDIKLIVVDYLQLMQGPTDSENRQQEISYISRASRPSPRSWTYRSSHCRSCRALRSSAAASTAAPALRPTRVGRHRAGRRRGLLHLPPGAV